ncbi:hypothetical protein KUTeg_018161 [Tegillarca granosa]|uniref:EXPERA domain-containing protein n=1 Tax=Tegillarca granosa TaxID=220873 RepID=A0ABQ9EH27_TEGGR|nr:hypothetical protein KUTeg_018161 [Tegillarca granosa]
MALDKALPIFLCGFLSIPLAFMLNLFHAMRNPILVLVAGVLSLSLVIAIPFIFKKTTKPKHDSFYYVWSIFTFSSVIDMVLALENDGIINSVMGFYLQEGEPYLQTAYGTFICYWDAIAHMMMYVVILSADSFNWRYRTGVLYWVGSIGHSMLVFLSGNFVGKFGVKWGVFINIPYLVIPILAGYKMLNKKLESKSIVHRNFNVFSKPADVGFLMYFILAAGVGCFRAFAVLGCLSDVTQNYLKYYEPYLTDPTQYPKMQMLVYLFYFVPFYVYAIKSLVNGDNSSGISDWAVIHAGAAAQAQIPHIGSSLHHMTDPALRVPKNMNAQILFWGLNITLLIIPQLFAYRCAPSNIDDKRKIQRPVKDNEENMTRSYNTRSKTRNTTKKDI